MREHQSAKNESAPWRFPVALDDVAENGAHFDLIADEEIRAAVARVAGLRELPRLRADFEVKRLGDDGSRSPGGSRLPSSRPVLLRSNRLPMKSRRKSLSCSRRPKLRRSRPRSSAMATNSWRRMPT